MKLYLPIEHKLHWLLRLGVVGCFIGHGAYGLLTKEAWIPYFGVVGIDHAWAYRLMPWVGAMDKPRQNILYTSAEINRPYSVPNLPHEEPLGHG
jgi:hypothetical protein